MASGLHTEREGSVRPTPIHSREAYMSTRTIAIAAFVIAVIVLILLLM
jgi:hypothetical protein